MKPDVLRYAEFDALWDAFQPETPFGRQAKEALTPLTDRDVLDAIHAQTEVALAVMAQLEPLALNRVTHHLKRLPRFPEEARAVYDEVELFAIKKFLHNALELVALLGATPGATFGLAPHGADLLELLDQGRQSAESFYVADAYDPGLALVRGDLRTVDAALARAREAQEQHLEQTFGFRFGGKDFLLVPRARLGAEVDPQVLDLDPYDETHVLVRPRTTAEIYALLERRRALLEQERILETQVLERLSASVVARLEDLKALRAAVTALDLALARARMAKTMNLVRPEFGDGDIRIDGGRFLPCETLCQQLGVPYTPLQVGFHAGATVIFGSNMGGKTVVLKTVASLQLAAQLGLYVPAQRFQTRIFTAFHYIGEGATRDAAQGLSGFGFEIRQVVDAWTTLEGGALLLFDEFARTTNSREAEALISAMLEQLAQAPGTLALFSTHFRGVRRLAGVDYRRMNGLRREELDREAAPGADLRTRIGLIDRHMDYHLVPDEGSHAVSDALAVARLLGLDPTVAARAEHFFTTL